MVLFYLVRGFKKLDVEKLKSLTLYEIYFQVIDEQGMCIDESEDKRAEFTLAGKLIKS